MRGEDFSVGGLAGWFGGTIASSYATGSVSGGGNYVGGLVGYAYRATITTSYATGSVRGEDFSVGGLVGYAWRGSIAASYATGSVSGSGSSTGGLVGYASYSFHTITYKLCYRLCKRAW